MGSGSTGFRDNIYMFFGAARTKDLNDRSFIPDDCVTGALMGAMWYPSGVRAATQRGPHRSPRPHTDNAFLRARAPRSPFSTTCTPLLLNMPLPHTDTLPPKTPCFVELPLFLSYGPRPMTAPPSRTSRSPLP